MSTTPIVPAAGVVWAKATRITPLDVNGDIVPGASVYTTDTLIKCTLNPVNEAGDQIAQKNANGDLGIFARKGDIPKWLDITLELVKPDPELEAALIGGTVLNDTSAAIGAPASPTVEFNAGFGSLVAGTYDYALAAFSVYGQTPISGDVTVTSGSVGAIVITGSDLGTHPTVLYGRNIGKLYQIYSALTNPSFTLSAATGTGHPTSLAVDALATGVPEGACFMVTGDTNANKIVFRVTEAAPVGSLSIAVEVLNTAGITTTIAAAATIPCMVDDGSLKPDGAPNTTDLSGGPGDNVGFQAPAPGVVANPYGVGLEFWMERVTDGHQDTTYPWVWFVVPRAANFVIGQRDVTNAMFQSVYTGQGFPNPGFGSGPDGLFPFDTSELYQWTVCGDDVVPTPSEEPAQALP